MTASEGCNVSPAIRTQFWLPLTVCPASDTSRSATTPTVSSGQDSAFHARVGSHAATNASGRPMAAKVACLVKIVYDECSVRRDSTLELDSTMTRPSPTSAAVEPSTR